MDTCPPLEDLLRVIEASTLVDASLREVDEHLETCPMCQDTLEQCRSPGPRAELTEVLVPVLPGHAIARSPLGKGAMGIVYRAVQSATGRVVALKFLSFDVATRRRMLTEARALAAVEHPNIVRLHDAREVPGGLVLVMEHVAGGSLARRLSGPVAPGRPRRWWPPSRGPSSTLTIAVGCTWT